MVLYYIAEEPSKRLPSTAFAVPTSCSSSSSSCRTPTMYYYNSTTTALLATSILQVTLDSSWKRHKIWDKPEIKVTLRLLRQATSSTMAFRMKKTSSAAESMHMAFMCSFTSGKSCKYLVLVGSSFPTVVLCHESSAY